MKRAVALVALALVLSGCGAFAGPSDGGADTPAAVSPVPVPDPGPTATAGDGGGTCLVPPPATPSPSTAETPTEPVALPDADGVVNGSALVDHHARELATHRFHLSVGNDTDAWVMPGASAFTYTGFDFGIRTTHAYAAGGTLYTLDQSDGGYRVVRRPYESGSPTSQRLLASLTGRNWLDERISRYDYTVTDTRIWNGTEVRVLEDTVDNRMLLPLDSPYDGLLSVNSTLYVDRRGIVRYVRHIRNIEAQISVGEYENVTQVRTMRVPSVGSTRVFRPEEFCVSAALNASVETPTLTERDTSETPTRDGTSTAAANGTTGTATGRNETTETATGRNGRDGD